MIKIDVLPGTNVNDAIKRLWNKWREVGRAETVIMEFNDALIMITPSSVMERVKKL